MLKDYLAGKNVQFEEKIVDQDEKVKEEMIAVSGGFLGVPYVVITKDDGGVEKIVGFDKGKLETLLV
jgi:glutaredoxin